MALSLALTGAELALLEVLFEIVDCLVRDAAVDRACFFFLWGGVGSSTVDVDDDDADESDRADDDELAAASEDPGSSS